ncbi:MAG: hypothetical protein H7333_08430 [Bdellovibrionales bacterium]|nr:hypothetical protein [Oligoflexia bacterium]
MMKFLVLLELLVLFGHWRSNSALAANCATPKFIFCSVTIGSENELNVFKQEAGAPLNNSTDALSRDSCILFHEFVKMPTPTSPPTVLAYGPRRIPYDSSETWDPVSHTYPWHQRMLEQDIPGYPGKKCDALLVSGHHDYSNTAGSASDVEGTTERCTRGYCLKRNQFIYSEEHYNFETGFSPLNPSASTRYIDLPTTFTKPNPGPRLILSQLVRTSEVCGRKYRSDDYPGSPSANSGKVLLSELKAVFLFACNLAAADGYSPEKGVFGETSAVALPQAPAGKRAGNGAALTAGNILSSEIRTRNYTFKERTQIIFGKALELYAFPGNAPGGAASEVNVRNFLTRSVKPKYRISGVDDPNYLTRHLEMLTAQKLANLPPSERLPDATSPPVAACRFKMFEPSCSMIKTGQSDQDANPGNHIIQCALDTSALRKARENYCSDLGSFYDLWDRRSDLRRYPLRTFQKNGAANRMEDTTLSTYDLQYFY